jgi:quercetin dioxygenase-like cupin family protein
MPFKCTIPAEPTVQRDDADIRITRWDFPPGSVTGQHTHGWPYVVVMLTDAVMRVDDGTAVTETRMSAGQAYHRPAGIEHDVMNSHSPESNPLTSPEIFQSDPLGMN